MAKLEMVELNRDMSNLYDLLNSLKDNDLNKFQEILKKNGIDVNYHFEEPELASLLDISCRSGSYKFVDSLLQYGADPNLTNKLRKMGPLHFAVENSDFLTVRTLLKSEKTEVNILDSKGNTPLHFSVKNPNTRILELLLNNNNTDVNIVNKKGKSPLLIALEEKNKNGVYLLLKNSNLNLNSDPLLSKTEGLLNEIIPEWKTIYSFESKLNYKGNIFHLLHAGKYDEFLSKLKEASADSAFLETNDGSHTFLQYSCEYGLFDVVNELICLDVNINSTTNTIIKTPLMIAAYKGYASIVKMLIDTGKCSYNPVNSETALHCVVKGSSESPGLGDVHEMEKDHLKCMSTLLSVQKCRDFINFGDVKGNTALHFAAKQGESDMTSMLLNAGASINCFNVLEEPSFADISYKTLQEYLDSCIYTNDKMPREESYEIVMNYKLLKPACNHSINLNYELGNSPSDYQNICKTCNNFESKSLLYLSNNRELKYLLKHPIFTSFLHLKWHRIRKFFCINLLFYLLFWVLFTCYILSFYPEFNSSETFLSSNYKSINIAWWLLVILVFVLVLRELVQILIAPIKYFMSFENWLEIALISVTIAILFFKNDLLLQHKVNLSAIGIMLSWSELVLLIGRHPLLSTKLEMLKTVSWNFLVFLAWYSLLIAAFAISFYILFGTRECSDNKGVCSNDTENEPSFFSSPGVSFFKTVIMLTGEFDASDIPFNQRPGISHALFVAFVFLIAIVLFNLLNGLAVSDIQAIKSDAELVSYISRVKLIAYLETLVLEPFPLSSKFFLLDNYFCKNSNTINYYKNKLFSKYINLYQNDILSDTCEIRILPNMKNFVEINQMNLSSNRKLSDCDLLCCKASNSIEMESNIVHSIKDIILKRTIKNKIKKSNEKTSENEKLFINMFNDFQLKFESLIDVLNESKNDIKKIKDSLSILELS